MLDGGLLTDVNHLEAEVAAGEGYNLEFKGEVPKDHKKYLKTAVAFANGYGGKILFGIADDRNVQGISEDVLFQLKDDISSSICDSISPLPCFDINPATVAGKSILVLEVDPGRQVPYFLKSEGTPDGVYMRVSGTTRRADPGFIDRLRNRGQGITFDAIEYTGSGVPDEAAIADLCRHLNSVQDDIELLTRKVRTRVDFTPKVLESLGVLDRRYGMLVPTNAYALLTDNPFFESRIQCLRYDDPDSRDLSDSKEYDGDVISQTLDAIRFVRGILRTSSTFGSILRADRDEIPLDVVRESIVNAVIHRDYQMRGSRIFVRVFPGKVVIETPGDPIGLVLVKPEESVSRLRNPVLARVFKAIGLFEGYGTGVRTMVAQCRDAGIDPPVYGVVADTVITTLKRTVPNHNIAEEEPAREIDIESSRSDKVILSLISENPHITISEISAGSGMSRSTVTRGIKRLREEGVLNRDGTYHGKWVITR